MTRGVDSETRGSVLLTPERALNTNAYPERFVRLRKKNVLTG